MASKWVREGAELSTRCEECNAKTPGYLHVCGAEPTCGGDEVKARVLREERIARRHQSEAACHEPTDAEIDAAELALRFAGKKAVRVVRLPVDGDGGGDGEYRLPEPFSAPWAEPREGE